MFLVPAIRPSGLTVCSRRWQTDNVAHQGGRISGHRPVLLNLCMEGVHQRVHKLVCLPDLKIPPRDSDEESRLGECIRAQLSEEWDQALWAQDLDALWAR